ncbi:MAG: asparagine synthetase B family protein [Gammaproteobacteria bacterium]
MTSEPGLNLPGCGGVIGAISEDGASAIESMSTQIVHRGQLRTTSNPAVNVFFGALSATAPACVATEDAGVVCADLGWLDPGAFTGVSGAHELSSADDWAIALLALFRARGLSAIQRLDGEYAIAIYETASRTLILARDYAGSKPLHYCLPESGAFAFASEVKALSSLAGLDRQIDLSSLQHAQETKSLPGGKTMFRHIHSMSPGEAIRISDSGTVVERFRIPPPVAESAVGDEGGAIELIRNALFTGLERCVGNQDDIGLALSGGIDSVGLAYALRQQYPNRSIHAFTAAHGPDDPELIVAARVADDIGAHHHTVLTLPEALSRYLPHVIWHLEGPISRSEALQLYMVGEAASSHVPVLLSAQGADALFAGMPRHRLLYLMKRFPLFAKSLQEFYDLATIGTEPRTIVARLMKFLKYRGRLVPVPQILGAEPTLRTGAWPRISDRFIDEVIANACQSGLSLSEHKFERAFSAFGVGHRSPFCERGFIRLAFSIDERLKIKRNAQKVIFRRALRSIVPDVYLDTPKHPQRMKYDSEFANALDGLGRRFLSPEAVSERGFFSVQDIQRLFEARRTTGYADEAAMRIWTALATEIWARLFLDGSSANELEITVEADSA